MGNQNLNTTFIGNANRNSVMPIILIRHHRHQSQSQSQSQTEIETEWTR